jgi:hypothetical protein
MRRNDVVAPKNDLFVLYGRVNRVLPNDQTVNFLLMSYLHGS